MEYYVVIEVQISNETPVAITNTYTNKNTAYQKFYTILSFAAVSQVPYHGAYILGRSTDSGDTYEERFFKHEQEPQETE